ncbi:MAG: hypothetical protein R3C20_06430 [Planctomycetaceae bacterium]
MISSCFLFLPTCGVCEEADPEMVRTLILAWASKLPSPPVKGSLSETLESVPKDQVQQYIDWGTPPGQAVTFEIQAAELGECLLHFSTDAEGVERVTACNERYAFILSRQSGDQPYLIQMLADRIGDSKTEAVINRDRYAAIMYTRAAAVFERVPITEVLSHPGLVLHSATVSTDAAAKRYKLMFELDISDNRKSTFYDASILFEAEPFPRVVQCSAVTGSRTSTKWTADFEYQSPNDPASAFAVSYKNVDHSGVIQNRVTHITPSAIPPDPAIFTLSHYGLSEPAFRRTTRLYWVLLLVIGVGLIVFVRKRRSK